MKHSTKINGIFYGVLFLAAGAAMTLAVPDRAWSGSYASRSRISEFESFMSEHPKASTELRLTPIWFTIESGSTNTLKWTISSRGVRN